MRTIETVLYKFSELSDEAKQTAIQEYRGEGVDTSCYFDEAHESIKKFHDVVGTESGHRSWLDVRTGHIEDDILELSGVRLRTYLINNFEELFYERKYINSFHRDERPNTHPMRTIEKHLRGGYWVRNLSNFKTESCCPLTGACYDEDLLQPFKEFIKAPDNRSFEDLINEAFSTLSNSLDNEEEHLNSDEAITEAIESNEYEFNEDGTQF